MGFCCFYGAEKVMNFDSVIWVGTLGNCYMQAVLPDDAV